MIITAIPYCPKEKVYTHTPYINDKLHNAGRRNQQSNNPTSLTKDLAYAYNEVMNRVNDDDWVCFLDHDAMFTTYDWYLQIEQAIKQNTDKDIGAYTCYTNRIGRSGHRQWVERAYPDIVKSVMGKYGYEVSDELVGRYNENKWKVDFREIHDIRFHRILGQTIQDKFGNETMRYPRGGSMSGVMILVSKRCWNDVKFPLGTQYSGGMLGTDNFFHHALGINGYKLGMLKGIYLYHWYRAKV